MMAMIDAESVRSLDRSLRDAASLFDDDIPLNELRSLLSTALSHLDDDEIASLIDGLAKLTKALERGH